MAYVYISIGSNVEREQNIRSALAALRKRFEKLEQSQVYETEAVGFEGQPFYNLVVGFETSLQPQQLVDTLRAIEDEHGRDRRGKRFSDRTLDLDLLLYDDDIIEQGKLKLPRDEILKYAFVLGPLAEIAGHKMHPVVHQSYYDLWSGFDDSGQPMSPIEF